MPEEKEVKPAQPEEVEVSSTAKVVLIYCKKCGTPTPRKGKNTQFCPACSKTRPKVHRQNRKERKKESSFAYNSTVAIKPKEARRILEEERGIRNPRILDVCIEYAEIASRNLKIPFNASLLKKGLQGTLAAARGEQPPAFPADVWQPGERVREHELFAEFDYVCSWRVQPDGTTLSFEDWKAYRRKSITDLIWFANTVLGKTFEQEPHGRWAEELFPQLEPALLSLPEKFGQKDIAKAFRALSDVRQRCLISARSSFKSTFSTVFMLALMLAFAGSLRILVCTATQPLAKGFAKSFRTLVTLRDPNNPTLFNQLWPEHCIAADDGKSLEYTSPFRQLDALIEPTLFITSVISEGQAGSRYDYGNFDDCAEISNSSTPEMRAKTQERIDMLRELGEPHSLTTYIGTPISQGSGTEEDPGDLYSVLLLREEKNKKEGNDPKLLYAICPAWTVNQRVPKKAWDPTLREDEVTLLFPSRLTYAYLMGKLKENLATDPGAKIFRQQALVSWVPDNEEGLRVTFTEDDLRNHLRREEFFRVPPGALTVCTLDRAYSTSVYADYSVVNTSKLFPVAARESAKPKMSLITWDIFCDRVKESELVKAIVDAFAKWHPTCFAAEKDKGWESLDLAVRRECIRRSVPIPFMRWVPTSTGAQTALQKGRRLKKLEGPLASDRLWFRQSSWDFDLLVSQFTKMDGGVFVSSNSHRKLDIPDAISTAFEQFMPRDLVEQEPEDPKTAQQKREQAEEDYQRAARDDMHNRIFGNQPLPTVMTRTQWEAMQRGGGGQPPPAAPAAPAHPRHFPRGGGSFAVLPGNMRGNPNKR